MPTYVTNAIETQIEYGQSLNENVKLARLVKEKKSDLLYYVSLLRQNIGLPHRQFYFLYNKHVRQDLELSTPM